MKPFNTIAPLIWVIAGTYSGSLIAQREVANAIAPDAASAQAQPQLHFQVLKSWKADVGDHSIIYNRVAPPVLPAATPKPAPTPMSPEFLRWMQAREQKNHVCVSLSATVYDGQFTVLRWLENDREHRAVSNIDFKYFCGIGEIETVDTIYSYFMGVGDQRSESLANGNPDLVVLAQGRMQLTNLSVSPNSPSAYVVAEHSASDQTSFRAVLHVMHAYYDANRIQLIATYLKSKADNAARQQWLKDQPPVPKDTVINFWPKKSTTNPAP